MDLKLRSQFDYLNYKDGTFDSEWVGGLNALANFTLVDERLYWMVQNNFGQALFDPLRPASPGNRENVNFFTTGPTLSFLPGGRSPIRIDVRYSRVSYEIRPNDNERLSGTLSIGRDISRESTVSVNLSGERVEFDDNELNPPIERYDAYVRYETTGSRSTFGIDIGYNQVEYDGNEGTGTLVRIDYSRETSANGTFKVSGGSRYSDQGNIFRFYREITEGLGETSDTTDTTSPFQNNFFRVSYNLVQERYSIGASADFNQEDYKDDSGNDRDVYRGNMRLQREVSRTVFVGARVSFHRREFKYQSRRDDDLILGVNIGYRFSAGFNVSIDYQYWQRNSITPGADFHENRVFIRASYTPVWSR